MRKAELFLFIAFWWSGITKVQSQRCGIAFGMKTLLTSFLCFSCLQLIAQPIPDWSSSIATNFDMYIDDRPSIRHDSNGDLIVVGNMLNVSSATDIHIIKYDPAGNIIWQQIFDNVSEDDFAVAFELDQWNNIYITGTTKMDSLNSDLLTLKYDGSGNFKWLNTHNALGNREDRGNALAVDMVGNCYVTGYDAMDSTGFNRQFVVHKIDSTGNTCWTQNYGLPSNPWYEGMAIKLINNTLAVSGAKHLLTSYVVANLDTSGTIIFFNETPVTKGIRISYIDHLGNFYFGSPVWYKLTKVDLSGNYAWEDSIPTNLPPNVTADELRAITVDSLLNVYTTGRHYGPNYFDSTCTKSDLLTIKYNAGGTKIWQQRYSHMAQNTDIGNCIIVDANLNVYSGGFSSAFTDTSEYDYVVVRYDQAGNNTGLIRFNGTANQDDVVYDFALNDTSCIYLTGLTFSGSLSSTTTQKYCSFSGVGINEPESKDKIKVFPNPFTASFTIENHSASGAPFTIQIFDCLGSACYSTQMTSETTTISDMNLKSGFYFIHVIGPNYSFQFKMIKVD